MGRDDDRSTRDDEHPLERAHRFFRKAAPAIREVGDAIERSGGIDGVREKVVRAADDLVQRVDEVVTNATAIEGVVVEPAAGPATEQAGAPAAHRRSRTHYVHVAIIAAAATYGALRLARPRAS